MATRRSICKILGLAGLSAVLGKRSALALLSPKPKREERPKIALNRFLDGDKALVGIATGSGPKEMITEALGLIGGLERLDVRGKRVLVKPNVVSRKPHPSTTNPAVVEAMVRILYEAGAGEVVVGDMSALLTLSTLRNMKKNGIAQAAERAGAKVVAFEDHGWVSVDLAGSRYLDRAYVTEWLYDVDLVVNLPVIKTHRSASYSICLKNFIGCTHLRQRPYLVDPSHWEELVAEFNLAWRPALNIVDGTVSMVAGGPWEGTPAPTNLVIASGDLVAADIVGLGVIKAHDLWEKVAGKDVWQQRQIRRALELKIGHGREQIELRAGTGDGAFADLLQKVRLHTRI